MVIAWLCRGSTVMLFTGLLSPEGVKLTVQPEAEKPITLFPLNSLEFPTFPTSR